MLRRRSLPLRPVVVFALLAATACRSASNPCLVTAPAGEPVEDRRPMDQLDARLAGYAERRDAARQRMTDAPAAIAPADADARLRGLGARGQQDDRAAQRLFTPESSEILRRRLVDAIARAGEDLVRDELAEALAEHEPADGYDTVQVGAPVSAPELPFVLSSALPRLPPGLEYRFSGDRLLLRDEGTSILLDMVDRALPIVPPPPAPPDAAALAPSVAAAMTAPIGLLLPRASERGLTFAVLGDTGTGRDRTTFGGTYRAHAVARRLEEAHARVPFLLALMLGDNMYTDPDTAGAYQEEVVEPYAALRSKGVVFRAVLGNHDTVEFQLPMAELNLAGRRFYSVTERNVRFLILHSDHYLEHRCDPDQDAFIGQTLGRSFDGWTVAAFHHPLFSSGTHRDQNEAVRRAYAALLDGRVHVVFTGHEHFYERLTGGAGPAHFVAGASAKLRPGDRRPGSDTVGFDDEHSFVLVTVEGDELYFQAIGLSGRTRDCGTLRRRPESPLSERARDWNAACQKALGS